MGDRHIFRRRKKRYGWIHLKITGVLVEWVVAEVHQAGDLDGDLDVEGHLL